MSEKPKAPSPKKPPAAPVAKVERPNPSAVSQLAAAKPRKVTRLQRPKD
jgi:hypothetical protein